MKKNSFFFLTDVERAYANKAKYKQSRMNLKWTF